MVITMDPDRKIFDPGYVIIEDDKILELGAGDSLKEEVNWIDSKGSILMPGFVNTHTHISMSLFRSLGEDMPDRLRKYLFPLEDGLLDPEMVKVGAKLSLLELIQSGVTTFCDMYYFEEEVALATKAAGVRAVLGQTILNKPSADAREPYGGLALAKAFIKKWKSDPLITPAFAPHAPYTCDDEHLLAIDERSNELAVPIVMHLAEMPYEVEGCFEKTCKSPVQHLEDIGFLSERLIAAHLIYVNDQDIKILAKAGVGVAHNICANAKSGRPVSPAPAMHQAGIAVGLGTDGPMSGNHQDVLNLLGYYTKIHKQKAGNNQICPAIEAVELSTIGGARALKLDQLIGSLEVGKQADMILVDTSAPNILPVYDPYSALVYAAHPHNVTLTMVAGKLLMKDRELLTMDLPEVMMEVKEQTKRIQQFARELNQQAGS